MEIHGYIHARSFGLVKAYVSNTGGPEVKTRGHLTNFDIRRMGYGAKTPRVLKIRHYSVQHEASFALPFLNQDYSDDEYQGLTNFPKLYEPL